MSALLARWPLLGLTDARAPLAAFARWLAPQQREGKTLWIEARRAPRSLAQNAKFHAVCADLAHSDLTWNGRRRSLAEWKFLLVSGHAHLTAAADACPGELARGLEGEVVYLRESTAGMHSDRIHTLLEYALAFCHSQGVPLSDPAAMALGFAPTAPSPASLALPPPSSPSSSSPSSSLPSFWDTTP